MEFAVRKVYSFDVYPAAVLGTGFKKVTVQAVLDYQSAQGFDDIEAIHSNIKAWLPEAIRERPQDFDYLLLRTEDGVNTVIGIPWIIEDSVVLVESLKAQVMIEDVGSADIERIRACLTQNGFNKIAITLIG